MEKFFRRFSFYIVLICLFVVVTVLDEITSERFTLDMTYDSQYSGVGQSLSDFEKRWSDNNPCKEITMYKITRTSELHIKNLKIHSKKLKSNMCN